MWPATSRSGSMNSGETSTAFDSLWSMMKANSRGCRRKLIGTAPQPALKQANIDSSICGQLYISTATWSPRRIPRRRSPLASWLARRLNSA